MTGPENPVVLIHDLAMEPVELVPLAEAVEGFSHVYLPDLPGCGLTRGETGRKMTIRELSDAVGEWMEAVGIDSAHFVANASGCPVAVDVAANFPERVRSLTLAGPPMATQLDDNWAGKVSRYARFLVTAAFEPMQLGMRFLFGESGRLARRLAAWGAQMPLEEKLPEIEKPCLLLRGMNDVMTPKRWLVNEAEPLKHVVIKTLPAGAHYIGYSHPELVAAAEREFERMFAGDS